MNFIKKFPLPISGLALGLLALGNLTKDLIPQCRPVFGIIALVILALLTLKIIFNFNGTKEDLNNPVVFGTFATFPMSFAIGSSYITNGTLQNATWFFALILHIILILLFTKKFILNFDIKKVFTTWFIMFVGIVAQSVTAPVVKQTQIGQICFYFGLVTYLVLLYFVIKRVYFVKNIPAPALPTLTVFAAPASLLLVGYLNSFQTKNTTMIYFILCLSVIFYILGLFYFIKYGFKGFLPSFSAFTFPMVISAMAVKMTLGFFKNAGHNVSSFKIVNTIQIYIAIFAVIYVLVRYIIFLLPKKN